MTNPPNLLRFQGAAMASTSMSGLCLAVDDLGTQRPKETLEKRPTLENVVLTRQNPGKVKVIAQELNTP